ncbi:MAG: hypothetical protein KBS70_03420 [Bacteroidales bacterium]|nr:hypothetical protein [Candidatus Colicola equi]
MTIEERARKCAVEKGITDNCITDDGMRCIEIGYKCGATDQRKIDIEKSCEWLRKIGAFSTLSFHDEEGVSQEVYEDMFRKAMED